MQYAHSTAFNVSQAKDDVKEILAGHLLDLALKRGGVGEIPFCVRADKSRDHASVYGINRIRRRYADQNTFFSVLCGAIPNLADMGEFCRSGDIKLRIGITGPGAETVDSYLAGVFSRTHAHPGGDSDRRVYGTHPGDGAVLYHHLEIGKVVFEVFEEELGRRTIQTYDKNFLFSALKQHLSALVEVAHGLELFLYPLEVFGRKLFSHRQGF